MALSRRGFLRGLSTTALAAVIPQQACVVRDVANEWSYSSSSIKPPNNKLYDFFVWSDRGMIRLSAGPPLVNEVYLGTIRRDGPGEGQTRRA